MEKLGRNTPCPCGSGIKYKHCCWGKIDWNEIVKNGEDWTPYLSVRGRNILFYNKIAEALQLDYADKPVPLNKFKAAFTADAVKKIYEALIDVWPTNTNISDVLRRTSCDVSGLYVGDYGIEYLHKGIVRHSIYANKILVVDPFLYPHGVRDKFNPIVNPEQHREQTLKNVNLWYSLIPWVMAGIVEIIRTPNNFDLELNRDSLVRQKKKYEENKELREVLKETTLELGKRHTDEEAFRNLILSAPTESLRKIFKEGGLEKKITFEQFMHDVENMREADPDFLEPLKYGEESSKLSMFSSGANYEIAKLTAEYTGSYLVTDLSSRWKEIELDRENHSEENSVWAPLAKAFQVLEMKYLNNLSIDHALRLRNEERLDSFRVFLRKVWKSACATESFSDINAKLLADELKDEVKKAEEEWKQIDRDLAKWAGGGLFAGLLAAGPMIATGHGAFLPAAGVATAGLVTLGVAHSKRKSFQDKFPAAFFMKLEK